MYFEVITIHAEWFFIVCICLFYVCVQAQAQICHVTGVEVQGQLVRVNSFFPPLNSCHQVWQQACLLSEPSHQSQF